MKCFYKMIWEKKSKKYIMRWDEEAGRGKLKFAFYIKYTFNISS